MLADVPAMPERVLQLAMAVAPEHVAERLADLRTRRHRLRNTGPRRQRPPARGPRACRRPTAERARPSPGTRRRRANPVANLQLNRHQPPIGRRDPVDLLGTERVGVEGGGALGALNNDMWSYWHRTTVKPRMRGVLNVLAAGSLTRMATEQVRMWRSPDEDRVLLMAGQTTQYAMEPRGEYVFGIVDGQPMRSRRGRERRRRTARPARRLGPLWGPRRKGREPADHGPPD